MGPRGPSWQGFAGPGDMRAPPAHPAASPRESRGKVCREGSCPALGGPGHRLRVWGIHQGSEGSHLATATSITEEPDPACLGRPHWTHLSRRTKELGAREWAPGGHPGTGVGHTHPDLHCELQEALPTLPLSICPNPVPIPSQVPRKVTIEKGDNKYSGYNFIEQVPNVQKPCHTTFVGFPFLLPLSQAREAGTHHHRGQQGTVMKVLFSGVGTVSFIPQLCCEA